MVGEQKRTVRFEEAITHMSRSLRITEQRVVEYALGIYLHALKHKRGEREFVFGDHNLEDYQLIVEWAPLVVSNTGTSSGLERRLALPDETMRAIEAEVEHSGIKIKPEEYRTVVVLALQYLYSLTNSVLLGQRMPEVKGLVLPNQPRHYSLQ